MRRRLPSLARRAMARRPGGDGGLDVSPRTLRIAGWVAAALLVVGVALVVGWLGGDGDGTSLATPSPSMSQAADAPPIAFGTAIDAVTGLVAPESETAVFEAGQDFAYSVRPVEPPPETIHVEVLRMGDSPATVQPPSPQRLPPDAEIIAFVVPADDLLAVFGPGQFLMRIFAEPTGAVIASGEFELRAPDPSALP